MGLTLADLVFTALAMLMGEEGVDYISFKCDEGNWKASLPVRRN